MTQKGQNLLASTLIYTGSSIVNALIPFLLLPVLTRVLSPEDYGFISMFVLLSAFLGALAGLSTQGSVTVDYYRHGPEGTPNRVAACLSILSGSTLCLALLLLFCMPWVTKLTKLSGFWVGLALINAFCTSVVYLRLALWRAQRRAFSYGGLQLGQGLTNAAFSLVLIFFIFPDWGGRVLGIAGTSLLFCIAALGIFVHNNEISWKFNSSEILHALRYGVPLLPHSLATLSITYADRFLIGNLIDLSQAGVYMAALQIGSVLGLLTESVNRAYSPWLWGKLKDGDVTSHYRIVRYTYLYFIFLGLAAGVLCLTSPWLLKWVLGPRFSEASQPFNFIVLASAVEGMYFMVLNYIFFARKTHYVSLVTVSSCLLEVPLAYMMISRNGIVGAAQALLVTKIFSFGLAWYFSHLSHPSPWWRALRDGYKLK